MPEIRRSLIGIFLSWIQGVTSKVTRLVHTVTAGTYIEGVTASSIGFWVASAERIRFGVVGDTSITSLPAGTPFRLYQNSTLALYLTAGSADWARTVEPDVDGGQLLGVRAQRWTELRQSRPYQSVTPIGLSAAAQLPGKNFAAGTAAVILAVNAAGIPVFRAVTPAVAGQTSILTDQAATLTRARAPSVEFFVDMDAAAIAGGVVKLGMTSDNAYGGATDAAVAAWNAATGFWRLQTYTGGALTSSTDTTVSHVAGTFQRIEIAVATDGSVIMYINGTSVKTAAAGAVGAGAMLRSEHAEAGAGGAAITVDTAQEDTRVSAVV